MSPFIKPARVAAVTASRRALLAAAAPFVLADIAAAQDSRQVDEIVVTARRVEENIQRTPVAVTALTAETLEARGAGNVADVAQAVPNVDISFANGTSGASFNAQMSIRGVGQQDFIITQDPGVGVYVDGVYFARGIGNVLDLVDLQRVEILRGPQGTLFGKNTIGGAVSLISKRPGDTFSGKAEATYGEFDRVGLKAAIDAPFSDKARSRFALSYKKRDGYQERIDGKDQGDENSISGRALFDLDLAENLTLQFTGDYSKIDQNSAAVSTLYWNPTEELAPFWLGVVAGPQGLQSPSVNTDIDRSNATGPSVNEAEIWGVSASLEWEASEALTFRSISAVRGLEALFGRDGDNSSSSYIETLNDDTQQQYSQEFQLLGEAFEGKANWILGAFYFEERATDRNQVRLVSGLYDALEAFPGAVIPAAAGVDCAVLPQACFGGAGNPLNVAVDLELDPYNRINTKSIALFAQGSYSLTEKLRATLGVRYTEDEKDYFLAHFRINSQQFIIAPQTVSGSWDNVSYRAGLDYQINPDLFVYASLATGYKAGGFNGRPTAQVAVDQFDPEEVTTYEIGLKSDLFDRRARLNLAAFFNKYEDIQITSRISDPISNTLVEVTQNAGEADVYGFEAELTARLTEHFDINAAIGLIENEYTSLNPGVVVTEDDVLPRTPDFTGSIGAEARFPLAGLGEFALRADYSYRSKQYNDSTNTEFIAQDAYGVLNARLGFTPENGGWRAAVFATNLTDERYLESAAYASSFGIAEGVYSRPREWGVTVGYQW